MTIDERKKYDSVRITVRLPLPIVEKLQDLVESGTYKNLSDIVRHALIELIDKHSPPPNKSIVKVEIPKYLYEELKKIVEGGRAVDIEDAIRNIIREYLEYRIRDYIKRKIEEEMKSTGD